MEPFKVFSPRSLAAALNAAHTELERMYDPGGNMMVDNLFSAFTVLETEGVMPRSGTHAHYQACEKRRGEGGAGGRGAAVSSASHQLTRMAGRWVLSRGRGRRLLWVELLLNTSRHGAEGVGSPSHSHIIKHGLHGLNFQRLDHNP